MASTRLLLPTATSSMVIPSEIADELPAEGAAPNKCRFEEAIPTATAKASRSRDINV